MKTSQTQSQLSYETGSTETQSSHSTENKKSNEQTIFVFSHICVMTTTHFVKGNLELILINNLLMLRYIPTEHLKSTTNSLGEFEYILKIEGIEQLHINRMKNCQHPTTNKPAIQVHFVTSPKVYLNYPDFLFPSKEIVSILIDQISMYGFKCCLRPQKKDTFPYIYDLIQLKTKVITIRKKSKNEEENKPSNSLSTSMNPITLDCVSQSVPIPIGSQLNISPHSPYSQNSRNSINSLEIHSLEYENSFDESERSITSANSQNDFGEFSSTVDSNSISMSDDLRDSNTSNSSSSFTSMSSLSFTTNTSYSPNKSNISFVSNHNTYSLPNDENISHMSNSTSSLPNNQLSRLRSSSSPKKENEKRGKVKFSFPFHKRSKSVQVKQNQIPIPSSDSPEKCTSEKPDLNPIIPTESTISKTENKTPKPIFDWSENAVGREIINPYMPMEILRSNTFYAGLKNEVRAIGWKRCLGGDYTHLYFKALLIVDYFNKIGIEWWKKMKESILKDIPRTELDGNYFQPDSIEFIRLQRILEAYCAIHCDVGFKQGMTDLLAVILTVVDDEIEQFSLFCNVIEFIKPFCENQAESLLTAFGYIIQTLDSDLYDIIMEKCNGFLFIYQWLVLLFKREFNLENILRIWDAIFAYPSRRFQLFIASAILLDHAEKIKQSDFRFDSLLIYLQDLNGMLTVDIIYEADLIYQTFVSSASIPVQRLVFGGESMMKKAIDRTQSPTISQPPSPKSDDTKDMDYETKLEIIEEIGEEPIISPLPNNPTDDDLEWHLISVADHDNWCRKCKLLLKKKQIK